MITCKRCSYDITEAVYKKNSGLCIPCSTGRYRDFSVKIPLQKIGFWKSESSPKLPDPIELNAHPWNEGTKKRTLKYLFEAPVLRGSMGYSFCRFECGINDEKMGTKDLYDGYWVWPEGLIHYVDSHSIPLPSEFVEHMEKFDYDPQKSMQNSKGTNTFSDDQEKRSLEHWITLFKNLKMSQNQSR